MKTGRPFAIVEALSTMAIAIVLVALILGLIFVIFGCCWLSLEIANTPIPTPGW
jgi:hypothetical protein